MGRDGFCNLGNENRIMRRENWAVGCSVAGLYLMGMYCGRGVQDPGKVASAVCKVLIMWRKCRTHRNREEKATAGRWGE